MPGPNPFGMSTVDELHDPVSYRYEMITSWGMAAVELSVDIKIDITDSSYYGKIGEALWNATIATAITRNVRLDLVWYVRWRSGPLALPHAPGLLARGRIFATAASKAHSAIVLQHTGDTDAYAVRAIHLPETPINWQTDRMLNDRGWDSLMTWAQGVKMGLAGDELGGDLQHLLRYSRIVPPSIDNLGGVLFRRVTHLKVMQFTDKAPDFTGSLWP